MADHSHPHPHGGTLEFEIPAWVTWTAVGFLVVVVVGIVWHNRPKPTLSLDSDTPQTVAADE
jgi:hypothetical protein